MSKKERSSKHMMGKSCGYTLLPDGSIILAQAHWVGFEKTIMEEEAVRTLLDSVTKSCHALLTPILERKTYFWDSVANDYSLDLRKYTYAYERDTHTLRRTLNPEPKKKP